MMSQQTEQQLQAALGEGYRLDQEIGAGGMGTVYLAEDLRHGRRVAVKVLRPEIAAAVGVERFHREIRIAARLQHPNILSLIDSGDAGNLLYYVMPYVEGSTLRVRLVRDGELPIDEGLRLLRALADALAYAHGQGIVHRDVKPENVLFMAGHALLADFGVARALRDRGAGDQLTEGGTAVGSPGYMAPESVAGDRAADHRADVYSLGVVAYEVLAGQHPFAGSGPGQMLVAHLTRQASPLWRVRPSVSEELSDVVMRCLEKRPGDRWQSAAQVTSRIDAALANLGGRAFAALPRELTKGRFRLTETVCRQLDRSAFHPRMIGDEMEYLDNGARSDVLVCFIHAVGLDGTDFEPHLRSLPYHGIAPTLYGFEPARRRRFTLPLADHLILLRELLRDAAGRLSPKATLIVGYSSGADCALSLAAAAAAEPAVRIDGVLALGCNLSLETCFLTRLLARLEPGNGEQILKTLDGLGEAIGDFDEWLDVHSYLVRMLRKFQLQVEPLREFGRDIVRPFEGTAGHGPFVRRYREASASGSAVRCLFEDTETCNRLVREVHLQNLDAGVLGPRYQEGSLVIEPDANHFDLLLPEIVLRHLDSLVNQRADAADRRTAMPPGSRAPRVSDQPTDF